MIKCGRPCKGEEQLSRDRLINAATQLFLEHGYANISMETIAKDAHVSLRTIYNQFGGKAGLFGALIRRCSDQWLHKLPLDAPLESTLAAFAKEFLYQTTRPDALRMRAILIGEAPRFPDLAVQFYEQGPKRTLNYLEIFFSHHQRAGRIKQIDPYFLADLYINALRGERFQRLQLGLELPPEQAEIDAWVLQVTHLFLQGCLLSEPN